MTDDGLVAKALEYARAEHAKIMALLSTTPTTKGSAAGPAKSTLAAIAQLAPAHLVSSMAIFQRIYVGSVQFDITEKDLEMLFGQFGVVKRIDMMQDPVNRRHRGFGFIEFDTAEAAALAQAQMDRAELGGRTVKVGRPNNFPADLPPGVPRPLPQRIYVANVHELVQEEELRLVFEAFGRVRTCHLTPDANTGAHKGYGYVEYESERAANSAIASLNNFELARRLLKVGKTITGGAMPPGMESLKQAVAGGTDLIKAKVPSAVLRAIEEINSTLTSKQAIISPSQTSVMTLRNLEDYAALDGDERVRELEADVAEECARFGEIGLCKVHLDHDQKTVTVFVKFSSREALLEAISVMHLRWFGGRQILAEPFDEQLFDKVFFQ